MQFLPQRLTEFFLHFSRLEIIFLHAALKAVADFTECPLHQYYLEKILLRHFNKRITVQISADVTGIQIPADFQIIFNVLSSQHKDDAR